MSREGNILPRHLEPFGQPPAEAWSSGTVTYPRRATGMVTAALVLAVSVSCSAGTETTEEDPSTGLTSSAPAESRTPTTSSVDTTPSTTHDAADAAELLLRQYFVTIDSLRQQSDRPLTALKSVAISSQLAAQKRLIKDQRAKGLRQTGSTKLVELTVQSVNLDNSDPQAGRVPTVQIDVCYDVSGVDVLNSDGASVVSGDRPVTGWVRYLVSNYDWAQNPGTGWRVASGSDLEREPCAST